jgi:hypothetical protein
MRHHLIARQWAHYAEGHQDRRNLFLHALSVPLFMAGSLMILAAPWTRGWLGALGALGALGMLTALAVQGCGHRHEATKALPFRGAFDFMRRLFVEQWVTFPRFVLSGGFARAWKGSAEPG